MSAAQEMRMRYGDVGDSNFVVHGKAVPLLVGLLCALVFFVALCLYLRWRCARYTPDDPEASSSPADAAPPLPGLDDDAIRALPVMLYRSPASSPPRLSLPAGKGGEQQAGDGGDREEETMCSICIGALAAGDKVKVLPPCGHCFHPECVDLWLRSHPSCPLCRCLLAANAKPEKTVNGTDEAV